jgi:small subunit ribosomal protein S6
MEMKKKYELMVILNSRIANSEIEKRLAELRTLLAEISFEELWGNRPFAYPIKGHEQGYYAVWNFMHSPEDVQELEKTLQLFPDLIRFLVLQVPENYAPITLKEIEEGLDELRKQKAEKRGSVRNAADKRKDDEKKASPEAPKAPEAAPAPKVVAKAAPAPAEEKATEEKSSEEKPSKKSFDQKLEDILSNDDLGL